jgi:hypothetical protein
MAIPSLLKVPPNNLEAEQYVLSAVFKRNKSIKEIPEITTDDFYREAHQIIYEAMLTLSEDGEVIDPVTVKDYLKMKGMLEQAGGDEYLENIFDCSSTTAAIKTYAKIVKEASYKRQVIFKCQEIAESAFKAQTDSDTLKNGITECLTIFNSNHLRGRVTTDILAWIENAVGVFYMTSLTKDLSISDKSDKNNVSKILSRLVEQRIIERYGSKNGCFRKIQSNFKLQDWQNAKTVPFDIHLPLGIERYCTINPGDLILIAGVTNSGKSALALEFAKLNILHHKIFLFSSEINSSALKKRLEKSDGGIKKWEHLNFTDEFQSMVDVIQPNDINILDYVEPPEGDYTRIAPMITDIHHRLDKGVAICVLQKKKSMKDQEYSFGVGGQMTLNKASLAINLDPANPGTKLTLAKVKDRKTEFNPEGKYIRFRIKNGINIIPDGVWEEDY